MHTVHLLAGDRRLIQAVPTGVPRNERVRFAELLRAELQHLHEGTAVRDGLRALDISNGLARKSGEALAVKRRSPGP